jgi:hypothetical protein
MPRASCAECTTLAKVEGNVITDFNGGTNANTHVQLFLLHKPKANSIAYLFSSCANIGRNA